MAVASAGGTLSPLSVPPLESGLEQVKGVGSHKWRADLVRMWDTWGRDVTAYNVVKQVAGRALGPVMMGQELEPQDL